MPRGSRACPRSPMIPGSKSMRSGGRPGCTRRVMRARTRATSRTFARCCSNSRTLPPRHRTARYRSVIVFVIRPRRSRAAGGRRRVGRFDRRRRHAATAVSATTRSSFLAASRRPRRRCPRSCATNSAIAARLRAHSSPSSAASMKSPPLALYAHFPWCVQKCPYCDFNSHTLARGVARAALHRGAAARSGCATSGHRARPLTQHFSRWRNPQSVFARRHRAVTRTRAYASSDSRGDIEITLEANPGTIERGKFRRISRGRRHAGFAGRAEFRCAATQIARAHSFRRRNAPRRRRTARGWPREFQPGSDVRASGTNGGRSAGGSACGTRAATRASVAVPPDDRARHAVRGRAARAACR